MRALKFAGKLVLGLVATVAALAFVALAEPQWFLNTRTAAAALRRFGASYRPRWKGLGLSVESDGLRNKRVIFHAEDLCLDEEKGAMKGCFPELRLDAFLRLGFSPPVSVARLETLIVRSGPLLRLDERAAESEAKTRKKTPKPASAGLTLVPRPLRAMTVGVLEVKVPRIEMITSTGTTSVAFDAAFSDKRPGPLTADLFAVVPGTAPSLASHYQARVRLDTDLLRKGNLTSLDAHATLKGDAGLTAALDAKIANPRPSELALSARAVASSSGRTLRSALDGLYTTRRASATATVALEDPAGPLRRAALERCRFDAPLGKTGAESADLKCAISLAPKAFGAKAPAAKVVAGTLAFHADFKRSGLQADHFTAALAAELGPEKTWYGFFARLKLKLAGRTGSIPSSLTAEHEFKTGFTIERFKDLVDALADTDFAIPAPLNALKGRAAFEAHTSGDTRGASQSINYTADTALASEKQSFKVSAKGRLTIEDMFLPARRVKDETEVSLKDVALQLPYLKLGPAPAPLPDSRIKTGDPAHDAAVDASRPQAKSSSSTAVDYRVRVRTEKPVRLLTNLIKDQVPIALDLKTEPAGPGGTVRIEPFDLQVFRQTAKVDHITLTLSPGAAAPAIDGKIVYKKEDTTVNILLLGSTEKPAVSFESTPPMTQDEIVAFLLYGKSPMELDSDQRASAGNASSGFASGAFGLASLFLFASTPVDSVGYDPASKTYEVKFKLPGGATLGVGSNLEESRMLTLRRRVARNLELETQVKQNSAQSSRDVVTTFLQWFRRY